MNDNIVNLKDRIIARAQQRKQERTLVHAIDDIVSDMDSVLDLIERAHGRGVRSNVESFWVNL